MEQSGKINEYHCSEGHKTVTKNFNEGTTPFIISCKHDDCNKEARSVMYRCDQEQPFDFIWRSVTEREMSEFEKNNSDMYEHCQMGGLVMKPNPFPSGKEPRMYA